VTTDQVEGNEDASANYIGTHHGVSYDALRRISGYYERAALNNVVFLRYQASTFVNDQTAFAALENSVAWASSHFGGPATCSGDDDKVGPNDTVIDSDNRYVVNQLTVDDQDPSCILSTGGLPAALGCNGDDNGALDNDDLGLPPSALDDVTGCEAGQGPILAGPEQQDDCVGDDYVAPDNDDFTLNFGSGPNDKAADCYPEVSGLGGTGPGGSLQPVPLIPPVDCSSATVSVCYSLDFGFTTPTDDRMWYETYAVFQVNACLGEVTLTARPQHATEVQVDPVLVQAGRVLRANCPSVAGAAQSAGVASAHRPIVYFTPTPVPALLPGKVQVPKGPGHDPHDATRPRVRNVTLTSSEVRGK
jgi:hypothetical protein